MRSYKKYLDKNGIDAETLQNIITDTKKDRDRMYNLYQRYNVDEDGPEIFSRNLIDYNLDSSRVQRLDDKVNNQLNNAFDAEIVDTKIGYMFGHPISYGYDKEAGKGANAKVDSLIEDFNLRNNIEDKDSEFGLVAAVCGKAARLAYVDLNGDFRIKNIDPCISSLLVMIYRNRITPFIFIKKTAKNMQSFTTAKRLGSFLAIKVGNLPTYNLIYSNLILCSVSKTTVIKKGMQKKYIA